MHNESPAWTDELLHSNSAHLRQVLLYTKTQYFAQTGSERWPHGGKTLFTWQETQHKPSLLYMQSMFVFQVDKNQSATFLTSYTPKSEQKI